MRGTLYLLPTQLGDGEWPTVLPAQTQTIACRLHHFVVENAKTARAALKWLGHPVPLRELMIEPLPDPLQASDIERLLAPLAGGHDLGLMSEAGCPGVADPGALLVRRAHALGIAVRPLVGPSSLLLALMASGLDGQRFAFHGYLPARDMTGHAERLLATDACRTYPPELLAGCTLYSSAEPCAMCAGAMYWAGIGRLVYGLSEARLKAITGNHPENPTLDLPCRQVFASGQRTVEVTGPLLEEEGAALHAGVW